MLGLPSRRLGRRSCPPARPRARRRWRDSTDLPPRVGADFLAGCVIAFVIVAAAWSIIYILVATVL
jgi:hypothetical protein